MSKNKEKIVKALKIGAIVTGVVAECGLIFLAYLGGGQVAQEMYHEKCSPHPDYSHSMNIAMQNALYGWDRLLNLGICQ